MALEDSVNNLVTQTTALLNTVNVAKSTLDTAVSSASASATAAAASYDNFDDRYLGPKSADPSLDNDNNALLEGAIYWNTTAKEFRVWNGTAWQADTIVGGTVANLNTTGSLQEGGVDVVVQTDIGTDPNQVPLNQYLGSMAYQDAENIAGDVGVGGDLSLNSGTANGVVYLNGSKVATSGTALTFTGTNLGVGTSSPSDKLHVEGVIRTAVGANYGLFANNYLRSYASGTFYFDHATVGQSFIWRSSLASSLDKTALTLDSSGNLIQTVNTTAATLTQNQTLTFSIVDNSTLRISVRGSDGTTRTATVALT